MEKYRITILGSIAMIRLTSVYASYLYYSKPDSAIKTLDTKGKEIEI